MTFGPWLVRGHGRAAGVGEGRGRREVLPDDLRVLAERVGSRLDDQRFSVGPPAPRAATEPIVHVSDVGEKVTEPEPAAVVAFVKTMPSAAGIVTGRCAPPSS